MIKFPWKTWHRPNLFICKLDEARFFNAYLTVDAANADFDEFHWDCTVETLSGEYKDGKARSLAEAKTAAQIAYASILVEMRDDILEAMGFKNV